MTAPSATNQRKAAESVPLRQHQTEILRNQKAWDSKPLLREIYAEFYKSIAKWIDPTIPGRVVELGSGIGNLRQQFPRALATDLFPNPWLDLACDGYELPFRDHSVSHLILFDVFHHLEAPNAFLKEARRALAPSGRVILFEPYASWVGRLAYGLFHHEPLGLGQSILQADSLPRPRRYYAAQGNATRLFFWRTIPGFPVRWALLHQEAIVCFRYLLSGGFSKPSMYPAAWMPTVRTIDRILSRWPGIFAGRCLVVLQRPQP